MGKSARTPTIASLTKSDFGPAPLPPEAGQAVADFLGGAAAAADVLVLGAGWLGRSRDELVEAFETQPVEVMTEWLKSVGSVRDWFKGFQNLIDAIEVRSLIVAASIPGRGTPATGART